MKDRLNELEIISVNILKRRMGKITDFRSVYPHTAVSELVQSVMEGGLGYSVAKEVMKLDNANSVNLDDYVENYNKFKKDTAVLLQKFVNENRKIVEEIRAEACKFPFYPHCESHNLHFENPYEPREIKNTMNQLVFYTADRLLNDEITGKKQYYCGKGFEINTKEDFEAVFNALERLDERAKLATMKRGSLVNSNSKANDNQKSFEK